MGWSDWPVPESEVGSGAGSCEGAGSCVGGGEGSCVGSVDGSVVGFCVGSVDGSCVGFTVGSVAGSVEEGEGPGWGSRCDPSSDGFSLVPPEGLGVAVGAAGVAPPSSGPSNACAAFAAVRPATPITAAQVAP